MSRFRIRVIVSILIMLPILQACGGGAPAPAIQETPAVDAALTTPGATEAVVPATGGTIAKSPSSSSPIAISEDDALLVVANNLD
ncbi:MAG TPA: hypothetical protein VFM05_12675, partial [Candidatus Saccharimonadales bacterium]|nr:hypothetical protein [Candidatus Saccharimonadales bacterium]